MVEPQSATSLTVTEHYCTYFDQNFLPRALALHASLLRHAGDFLLEVLCLDDRTHELLRRLQLPRVRLLRLAELEQADPALQAARAGRSWVEYVWTLTSPLILHVLERGDAARVTYLDADLYFYSSPQPVFEEFGDASVMLIPHRFHRIVERATRLNGIFNVGMMTFRRDEHGLQALRWWREQCLAACHADHRDGKFGDQKYLDDWPTRFSGVKIIAHPGANVAPWNVGQYRVVSQEGRVTIDGVPLIFFHFHKLDILGGRWFRIGMRVSRAHRQAIYPSYLQALAEAYAAVRAVEPQFRGGILRVTWGRVWQWVRQRRLIFLRGPRPIPRR